MTPEAILHVIAGSLGLLFGAVALVSRKGGRVHRSAGTAFIAVMLTTAASGVYIGFARDQINNAIAGVVTIYLVSTAWMTVRRREGGTGLFELGAFLFATAGAATAFYFAFDGVRNGTAMMGGLPYLIIAAIVALAAALDLNAIVRGGLSGKHRIARHLWRMNLGFAAAVGSFFPGQVRHMPEFIREIKPFIVLFTPFFLVIALMLLWLVRVYFTGWIRKAAVRPRLGPESGRTA